MLRETNFVRHVVLFPILDSFNNVSPFFFLAGIKILSTFPSLSITLFSDKKRKRKKEGTIVRIYLPSIYLFIYRENERNRGKS